MSDLLYWTTYPFRRFVSWARHRIGSCCGWCAYCITEYYDNLTPAEIEENTRWAEFAETQWPADEKTLDKQT